MTLQTWDDLLVPDHADVETLRSSARSPAFGPSASTWDVALVNAPPFRWPPTERVVVVSPHPDDETLGVGGLISMAVDNSLQVVLLSVTNGEAAYPHDDLASVRRQELADALACLGETRTIEHHYLNLADGNVARCEIELRNVVRHFLLPGDLVLCPLVDDGHSDHEATATAAIEAAHQVGAHVRCFPIWAWCHHDTSSSTLPLGERLLLTETARKRKQRAIACFQSQIGTNSPIVPTWMLEHFDRRFEILVHPSKTTKRPDNPV
jgi:LmbE family N-acetylglucosaminyl deacetylase